MIGLVPESVPIWYHVQSFIAKHEAELLANWESLNSESGTYFTINP